MANVGTQFIGQLADAVVAYYVSEEGALTAYLSTKNQTVGDFLVQAADKLVANVPVLGPLIANALKNGEPQLIAYFGSEEKLAVAALGALLQQEAKALGG